MSTERPLHPIIVLTAPSGAGKTTIAHRIMDALPRIRFSVSATTRPPRTAERDGIDYHFVTEAAFRRHIEQDELIEYQEVYPGRFYGTLRTELEQKTRTSPILLDIDVKGALNVKRLFGDRALVIFIAPPSLAVLEKRLNLRNSETPEALAIRLERARMEIAQADKFDRIIVNDDLDRASSEAIAIVEEFLRQPANA
ncbi:MAG TPA: guanylate kinase [Rhodothermales bacterium]|nr:guanylate kinase [Rhodothermales bacterium]